jgi:hypothetical protein
VPGGIRTPNLLIRSQKLYPVELQALLRKRSVNSDLRIRAGLLITDHGSLFTFPNGVADGTRTRNNQNHNLGLYH